MIANYRLYPYLEVLIRMTFGIQQVTFSKGSQIFTKKIA